MKKYVLAGLLFFVGFAVAFAPAGILDRALDGVDTVDLVDARGTLWNGSGTLLIEGALQGDVTWAFEFLSLLRFNPTYAWRLTNDAGALDGKIGYGGDTVNLDIQGSLLADLFNPWLDRYDIYLTGEFDIEPTSLVFAQPTAPRLTYANGEIAWTGGLVRYTLSGKLHETMVPPLVAYLEQRDDGSTGATVFERDQQTPLLFAEQSAGGFVKVGMTKGFTKVLNNPWPGSDPDHAVVLEVEEQIF